MTLKEDFETEKSNHLHQVLNIQLAGVKIQETCMQLHFRQEFQLSAEIW